MTIPFMWNLILDMSPPDLYFVKVQGYLFFHRNQNITLRAHIIWVSEGTIFIGSAETPYENTAEIVLLGEETDP